MHGLFQEISISISIESCLIFLIKTDSFRCNLKTMASLQRTKKSLASCPSKCDRLINLLISFSGKD